MKEMKFTKSIKIVLIAITIIFMIQTILQLILLQKYPSSIEEALLNQAEKYGDDPEVLRIYELCRGNLTKVKCVNYYTNFTYDYERTGDKIAEFRSPKMMMELGGKGVCKDMAIFYKAVLDKFHIKSKFIFPPNHVYVLAEENGKVYELNNQYLFIR